MFVSLVLLTLLAAPSRGTSDTLRRFKALRFTQEPSTYIQFNPDFSRHTHAISVCGWIKSLGSASYPAVFYYHYYELTMMDNGNYICIFGPCLHLAGKFSVSKRTWYHTCITWGASSRSHKYYVNGELLGSQQTPSGRLLPTGRTLTLGNWGGGASNHEFGGEMTYLNFYAKELSASEVQRMVDDGMCNNMAVDEHEEVRLLKWEDILKQSRSGTITEVDMTGTCASTTKLLSQVEQVEAKLKAAENRMNETAEELTETQQELEEKKEAELSLNQDLENVSNQLNATLVELEDVSTELNRTKRQLNKKAEEFTETRQELEEKKETELSQNQELKNVSNQLNATLADLNRTNRELLEFSTRLNETEEELGRAMDELENYNKTRNKWDWNIFQSEQYINKTVSSEQSEQIRTSWDDVAQSLVGYTITDELIKFWKIVDCSELENRPWSMLYSENYLNKVLTQDLAQRLTSIWDGVSDKLVGVTMTEEIIKLLKYVSEETNCYCGN